MTDAPPLFNLPDLRRGPLRVDGRRVVFARSGRLVCEAVNHDVARRICFALGALSGLDVGHRLGAELPGAVRRILLAADGVVEAVLRAGQPKIDESDEADDIEIPIRKPDPAVARAARAWNEVRFDLIDVARGEDEEGPTR